MKKLEQLIKELCPNGVEYTTIGDCCNISAGGDIPKNKFSKEKTDCYTIPIISNGIGENALYGYTDRPKINENAVTIAARGTIGYAEYRDFPYYPIVRLLSLIPNNPKKLSAKFLFYSLQGREYSVPKTGIPQLTAPNIKKEIIPIPPLPVQEEIVRILDTFTELAAELTAELTARRKQYEYYRDRMLTFDENHPFAERLKEMCPDGVERKVLGSMCKITTGKLNANAENPDGNGKYPFFTCADTPKTIDYYAFDCEAILIAGNGNIGNATHYVGKFNAYQRTYVLNKFSCNARFLYHAIQCGLKNHVQKYQKDGTLPYITLPVLESFAIPIPPLSIQEEIVRILDQFESLCNDITSGLPAEIEARQKQYEYYRDKLLRF